MIELENPKRLAYDADFYWIRRMSKNCGPSAMPRRDGHVYYPHLTTSLSGKRIGPLANSCSKSRRLNSRKKLRSHGSNA